MEPPAEQEDDSSQATILDKEAQPNITIVQEEGTTGNARQNTHSAQDIQRQATTFNQIVSGRTEILRGLAQMKYEKPTYIQATAIPLMLKGRNLVAQAPSGTGKTGTFLTGVFCLIDPSVPRTQALVVGPTRELVRQIYDVAVVIGGFTGIKIFLDVPDCPKVNSIDAHLVIGTPGKVLGDLDRNKINSKNIRLLVLDEADSMLGVQGTDTETVKIRKKMPTGNGNCQICLFSATFNEHVQEFTDEFVPSPKNCIFIEPEKLSIEKLIHSVVLCRQEEKFQTLSEIFEYVAVGQSIIFVRSRETAKKLHKFMIGEGHEVSLLHGHDMDTAQRDQVIDSFRNGLNRILISTNVLSRGIDVLQVSLVVNFDIPVRFKLQGRGEEPDFETYLHRVGRTARYNKPGLAINFVHNDESKQQLQQIQNYFKIQVRLFSQQNFQEISEVLEDMETNYDRK